MLKRGKLIGRHKVSEEETVRIRREVVEELRPHFVFNTMNVLRYLVRTDPDKAYMALYDLARFMRGSVEKIIPGGMISLKEELAYARSYLNLEQIQRRLLTVEWNVQDEEGDILSGSISAAAAELLRNDPEFNKQERTLSVEKNRNDNTIKIFVDQTGEGVEIPVSVRDEH